MEAQSNGHGTGSGAVLSRDLILAAHDFRLEKVDIPEWGGYVFVRSLTGAERDRFEAGIVGERKDGKFMNYNNLRARLVALTCCDADGKRLFADGDVAALGDKNAGALQKIFNMAQKLSGLSDEDVAELTKNSEPARNADSISA